MRLLLCLTLVILTSCQTPHGMGMETAGQATDQSCDSAVAGDDIRRTIEDFYAALGKYDIAAVQRVTTPDFYAFEIGKRYSARELSDVIAKSHADGRITNWGLGPMSLQVDCSIASATWENTGSAGKAGELEARAWLESAVLRR